MSVGDINPYAAPRSFIPLEAAPEGQLWQTGKLLLVRKGAHLPDRCVKCNAPADGRRIKRAFSWHPPAYFLLVLAGLIIYVIVAIIVRQTITLQVGICYEHAARRRWGILVGWCSFLAGLALMGLSLMLESPEELQLLLCVGLAILVAGPIYGLWRSQIVWVRKIDKEYAWIAGVCNEYLAQLPLIEMPP